MSIKFLELVKHSELGNLSIDEQIKVKGGSDLSQGDISKLQAVFNLQYEYDLRRYTQGASDISSSGDIVTFKAPEYTRSYKNGNLLNKDGMEALTSVISRS